jgi:hypothetical protein
MTKAVKSNYKARVRRNGGADRYGTFREGRQMSSDIIAGKLLWSVSDKKVERV